MSSQVQSVQSQPNDADKDMNLIDPQYQPKDTVSCMEWLPNVQQRVLAVGCWDGLLKVYSATQQGIQQAMEIKFQGPISDISWKNDGSVLFVAVDNSVKQLIVSSQQIKELGKHQAGVSNIFWNEQHQILISTGFDKCINLWNVQLQKMEKSIPLNQKVYCGSANLGYLAMGLQGEKICIANINQLKKGSLGSNDIFDSVNLGTNSQICTISISKMNGKNVFAVGSIDGRANISSFEEKYNGSGWNINSIMTFKCHKDEQNGKVVLHPVNGIGFNARNEHFVYTAGSEGKMHFWDIKAKNKIKSFSFQGTPVCCTCVSMDGQLIAYGLGYDWHGGFEKAGKYENRVCVHQIIDNELKHVK